MVGAKETETEDRKGKGGRERRERNNSPVRNLASSNG